MQVLGENDASVKGMLNDLGIYLKPSAFSKDVRPLLKEACSNIFGPACGLVDMLAAHIPSVKRATADKVHCRPMRSASPTKVVAKCAVKYCRISWCVDGVSSRAGRACCHGCPPAVAMC